MSGATKAGLTVGVLATVPTFVLPGLCGPVIAIALGLLAGWLAMKLTETTDFTTTTPARIGTKAGIIGGAMMILDLVLLNALWLITGGATEVVTVARDLGFSDVVRDPGFDIGIWLGAILIGILIGAINTGLLALVSAITAKVVGPDEQPVVTTATTGAVSTATWRTNESQTQTGWGQ